MKTFQSNARTNFTADRARREWESKVPKKKSERIHKTNNSSGKRGDLEVIIWAAYHAENSKLAHLFVLLTTGQSASRKRRIVNRLMIVGASPRIS